MEQAERADADERVPLFGTWPRIYAAVLVTEALVLGLLAAFQVWRF